MERLTWLIGKRMDLELQGKLLSLTQAKELAMLSDGLDPRELKGKYASAMQEKLSDYEGNSE